jgi:hypothetical protein
MDKRFELLPQEMKTAIEVLQELHNVPDSMALQVVLGTVNLAVQAHYDVDSNKYGIRPTSLFLLALAPTGGLKSTIFKETNQGIMRFRDDMRKALENDVLRFKLESKKYDSDERKYLAELDKGNMPLMPTPPKPIEGYNYCIGKATLNGLIDTLKSQSFLGLFSSEAGDFFNGHAFQGKNAQQAVEMTTALTKMWDGDPIERITGVEQSGLWNRRTMMLFLLQTEVVQPVLNNKLFSAQGFIHRLLITQTEKFEKLPWDLTEGAKEREQTIRDRLMPFHDQIYKICRKPLSLRDPNKFELIPVIIKQTPEASLLLGNFYNENILRGEADLKRYAGFAERLHEHCLRIAATLAAFDQAEEINQIHALAAIDLMDFYCEQRKNLEIGVTDKDPIQTDSVKLLKEWIQEKSWSGAKNKLDQFGPRWYRILGIEQRQAILDDLVRDEFLIPQEAKAKNGRNIIVFSINTETNAVIV